MDWEKILERCAILGIDAVLLAVFYRLYKEKSNCALNLKEAQHLEINNDLVKKVEDSGGTIPYASVTGKVKASSSPLRSDHTPSLCGVMQEKIINEYKIRWIPSLRIWSPVDNNINRKVACVPFSLIGEASFFQKKRAIEIINPFLAEELVLKEVYNNYRKYDESFGETIIGFLSREHTVGIKEVENMLLENTTLTAIGKLTIENENLKMSPPDGNVTYFLTTLSYDSLYNKINSHARVYKGMTIVMGIIMSVLIAYYGKKIYEEIRRRIDRRRDLQRYLEAKKHVSKSSSSKKVSSYKPPKCVVCLEDPVEMIVLDCGHACLCFNCADHGLQTCPMCRMSINRLIPVYMP
ncbi:mitochondrial E3 ubiquitin protein ligase 1 [Trichonephila inaurata madagascariensis]|uniref:RING-type E3 ubiquitin transferase n=1 Tax=Trichonephila inaurata madagascariensis TaxID=2747483 RepID=A0A8X6X4X4_9ARAC|nr:mitochondrial E3 ubiquitin protein ligase 1 [Trichonephila inaurata madagascariensis]